ncbi:MAG: 23S rRNA (adenine(2503)-C(2))-methyltransferase RlmN [Treponema sp.]|nr:23S rRNA (adenine(2503)-C(2))-methyltransferase RlmN [Treponema sp.]
MEKIQIAGLLPEEIKECFRLDKVFRANQIFSWISKGISSFDEMTNISIPFREELKNNALLYSSSVTNKLQDTDGTVKLQITTSDNLAVETVLLKDKEGRKTACVSSQVGCAMKCAICKTGTLGFSRNLTAAEIVEQFLFLEKECGELQNIVFMGMGEPLLNLSNVTKAISILTHKNGRNLSARRITISTCGIVPKIYELAESTFHVRLALSLVSANQEKRNKLMPGAAFPLSELKKAISHYSEKTGRRTTLEAVLLSGVNTSKEDAEQMIQFAKGLNVNINLIPWNKVSDILFQSPSEKEISFFASYLKSANLNVTIRTHRGRNISGACGQLGRTHS